MVIFLKNTDINKPILEIKLSELNSVSTVNSRKKKMEVAVVDTVKLYYKLK